MLNVDKQEGSGSFLMGREEAKKVGQKKRGREGELPHEIFWSLCRLARMLSREGLEEKKHGPWTLN